MYVKDVVLCRERQLEDGRRLTSNDFQYHYL
jgi:hypothetical protein